MDICLAEMVTLQNSNKQKKWHPPFSSRLSRFFSLTFAIPSNRSDPDVPGGKIFFGAMGGCTGFITLCL
jgi:hypothetical protein